MFCHHHPLYGEQQTIERDNGDHHHRDQHHHPTGRRVRDPPRRFEKENHVLVRSGRCIGDERAPTYASAAGNATGRDWRIRREGEGYVEKDEMMRDASDRQVNQACWGY